MGYARVLVSKQLLLQALAFPAGTEIVSAALSAESSYGDVELTLRHPDLKPINEGDSAPLVTPTFRKQDPVVFVEWGQK